VDPLWVWWRLGGATAAARRTDPAIGHDVAPGLGRGRRPTVRRSRANVSLLQARKHGAAERAGATVAPARTGRRRGLLPFSRGPRSRSWHLPVKMVEGPRGNGSSDPAPPHLFEIQRGAETGSQLRSAAPAVGRPETRFWIGSTDRPMRVLEEAAAVAVALDRPDAGADFVGPEPCRRCRLMWRAGEARANPRSNRWRSRAV
jgi:hypothetical protein